MSSDERGGPPQETSDVEDRLSAEREDGTIRPPGATDTEVLESVRRESRRVLDYRIDALRETDDKAAKTTRTAVLVLGILLSVVNVGGVGTLQDVPEATLIVATAGMSGLFVTVIYGIVVYSDSETTPGPNESFRMEPRREAYSKREWLVLVTLGYEEWITDVKQVNDRNASQLWRLRLLLVSSLFAFLLALGLLLLPT